MTAAADCRPPDRVVYQMARAICRERCAFMGEPACWQVDADDGGPYPWPPESCDSPGCMDLAQAAAAAIATSTPPTSHARPPMSEAPRPPLAEQLVELRREEKQRERVFPRWVADGRMSQAVANLQMARLRAAIDTLEACQAGTPPPPDPPPAPPPQGDLLNG